MAAKGGGSWKVAYADFVTAMMAFFLVMWICSQDQNTREAVAHYFNEPYQFFKDPVGSNRKPERSGALFKEKSSVSVPESEKVALGRGRESFSPSAQTSPPTKAVSDWLHGNEKATRHWRAKATEALETASLKAEAQGDPALIEEKATLILAEEMKAELKGNIALKRGDNLYDDLLGGVLDEVNWGELAEDILRQERLPGTVRRRSAPPR
jgi:chemotaxis protein MotB